MVELVGSMAVQLAALVKVFELAALAGFEIAALAEVFDFAALVEFERAALTEMRIFAQVVAAALVILMGLSDSVRADPCCAVLWLPRLPRPVAGVLS